MRYYASNTGIRARSGGTPDLAILAKGNRRPNISRTTGRPFAWLACYSAGGCQRATCLAAKFAFGNLPGRLGTAWIHRAQEDRGGEEGVNCLRCSSRSGGRRRAAAG